MPLNLKFVSSWIMPNSTSIPRIQLCESQPHQPWEIAECEEEVVKFVSITIKTRRCGGLSSGEKILGFNSC